MFESLSDRLGASLKAISGKSKLTEDNIRDTLRDVRMTLLEADVALPVVKTFTDRVKDRAVGTEVSQSLSPGQAFLKVVQAELQAVMGGESEGLNLATQPPAVVMVAGLQGAGKTTSVAKLARYLIEREKKKVSVVSADVYRPAAIKQLETLAAEVGARFEPSDANEIPVDIVRRAIADARVAFSDVLLVDTAGRLAIDDEMMAEISALHEAVEPIETLFVVDAMTGQDAANTAKAFGKGPAADRHYPDQSRCGHSRRRGAIGAHDYRATDKIFGCGGEDRCARSFSSRSLGFPHFGYGRHVVAY
jgi:signal recognition particle subunit SRP54